MGLVYALAAYLTWGLVVPVHFRLLDAVPAPSILAHRIVWSSLLVAGLLAALRRRIRNPFPLVRRHGLLVLSAGPMLQWRRDTMARLWPRVRRPALVAAGVALVTAVVAGPAKLLVVIGFALAAWVIAGAVAIVIARWRLGRGATGEGGSLLRRIRATPPSVYGLIIAHLGMGILAAGVTAASAFSTDRVATMRPGDKVTIGGVTARLDAFAPVQGPNFQAIRADFTLISGSTARLISSERRFYPVSGTRTTVAGITDGVFGNTYVAIGDPGDGAPDGALVVRLYDHPLVGWIWAGPMLMALGGLFSLTDRRHRIGAPVRTPVATTGPLVPLPA